MKPRDVFGIILRTFALYLCLFGTWYILAGIKYLPATFLDALSGGSNQHTAFGWFIYGVPALLVGLLMLRFAEGFVSFTYRTKTPPPLPGPHSQSKPKDEDEL